MSEEGGRGDQREEIAKDPDDPRVWVELRPAPDSDDEYELVMTTPKGTKAYRLPYSVGGLVLDEMLPGDDAEQRGVH